MIPDAANPLSSPEFIHPGESESAEKKATLVPWLVRNTCSFIKSWCLTPPPLPVDAALTDYKNMTKGVPGAKSFSSETGLLAHIQERLLNFDQQTPAIASQPASPSPLCWLRIKQDALTFLHEKCSGQNLLPAQPLVSEQQLQRLVQTIFPEITDKEVLTLLASRYRNLNNLLLREIYQVTVRPALELAPGAGIHLLTQCLAWQYPLVALAIQGINAIRLAPRQGIKPGLHLLDQWACVPLLGRVTVDTAGCRPVTLVGVIARCHDIVSDAIAPGMPYPTITPEDKAIPLFNFTLKLQANSALNYPTAPLPLRLAANSCAEFLNRDTHQPFCPANVTRHAAETSEALQGPGVVTFTRFTGTNNQRLLQEGVWVVTGDVAMQIFGSHISPMQSPVLIQHRHLEIQRRQPYSQQTTQSVCPAPFWSADPSLSAASLAAGSPSTEPKWQGFLPAAHALESTTAFAGEWWDRGKRGFGFGVKFELEEAASSSSTTHAPIPWPTWIDTDANAPACLEMPAPLETAGLRDMINQLGQRIETLPTQQLKSVLEEFVGQIAGDSRFKTTLLAACERLVSWDVQHERMHVDPEQAANFIAGLPGVSAFRQYPESIDAFVRSPRGTGALAYRLLLALDHALDATGRPLLSIQQLFLQRIKPATTYGELAALLVETDRLFIQRIHPALERYAQQARDILEAKLRFLLLPMLRQQYPMLKLSDHPDLSSEPCLSATGFQRAAAAHEIQDPEILEAASGEALRAFGLQLIFRRAPDALQAEFAATDALIFNPRYSFKHYLAETHQQAKRLDQYLQHAFRLRQLLNQPVKNATEITQRYNQLRESINAWYQPVLENLSADDEAFFQQQFQTPQGVSLYLVHLQQTTGNKTETSCVGCYLTASRDIESRTLFITPFAQLNKLGQPDSFDASNEFSNRVQTQALLNDAGKIDMLTRIYQPALRNKANIRFLIDEGVMVKSGSANSGWPFCAAAIARQISERQFPDITIPASQTAPTSMPSPDLLGVLFDLNPLTVCYNAVKSVMQLQSVKNIVLHLLDCGLSAIPEEEAVSEIEKVGKFALRSAYHYLADHVRDHPDTSTVFPLNIGLAEAGMVDDSLIGEKLCRCPAFNATFGKELLWRSLPVNDLPRGYTLTGVSWDEFSDRIHCNVTTPDGIKHYQLDRFSQHLLPHPEMQPATGLTIPVAEFLDALKNQQLPMLISSLSPLSPIPIRFNAVEAENPDQDIVYNHLDHASFPPEWRYQRSWIKTAPHTQLIVEFKNARSAPVYVQLNHAGQWRDWLPPTSLRRENRDPVTRQPLFFDALTPSSSGYHVLAATLSAQRSTAAKDVTDQLLAIPQPQLLNKIYVKGLFHYIASNLHPTFESFGVPAPKQLMEELSTWREPLTDGIVKNLENMFNNYKLVHYLKGNEEIDKFVVDMMHVLSERKKYAARYNDFLVKYHKYSRSLKNLKQVIETEYSTVKSFLMKIKKAIHPNPSPFVLKSYNEEHLLRKYPLEAEIIRKALGEVHHTAGTIRAMLDPVDNPTGMLDFLKSFLGKRRLDSTLVATFQTHFINILQTAETLSVDDFYLVEDRFLNDGRIPASCARLPLEKSLLGSSIVGYVSSDDNYKRIYLMKYAVQQLPIKELANVIRHEGSHVTMSAVGDEYIGSEVYLDAPHPIKKLTLHGMSVLGKKLLSDSRLFQNYVLNDEQFLDAFLTHFHDYTHDPLMKVKIEHFRNRFLPTTRTINNNKSQEDMAEKYALLTPVVDSAFNNPAYMMQFILRNADWVLSLLGWMLDYARKKTHLRVQHGHKRHVRSAAHKLTRSHLRAVRKRETTANTPKPPPAFYNKLGGANSTTDQANSLFIELLTMLFRNKPVEP